MNERTPLVDSDSDPTTRSSHHCIDPAGTAATKNDSLSRKSMVQEDIAGPLPQHFNNDDDDESDNDDANFLPLHGRNRSSSIMEAVIEQLGDVVETIEETFEEVYEEVKEVLEEEINPIKPREEGVHSRKLSALALAVLVFYKVSGGPFGCEPSVKAAGPFYALLGFLIFPFCWCCQEALITAELGSAFPEPSGAVAWVEEAWGSKAGLLCGYFHWVSGATDNAIYPSLFLKYVASFMEVDFASNIVRFFFCVVMTIILAIINWSGLEIVGNLSILVCVVSMSPFILLCIIGAKDVDVNRWFVMPEGNIDMGDDAMDGSGFLPSPTWGGVLWRPFLNSLFWNLNSFDVGACFAGEVRDPERVFPRAMFLSVFFVVSSYLLPLTIALGATDSRQDQWNAGFLVVAATKIGGNWLGAWTVFASAISNIALFEAEMSGDAYQLMGMAERGLIPKVFTRRSRFGTPTNGILVGTGVIFCLSVADFDALVEMLNFSLCLSMLMEFSAFIKLRITDGDHERPFRIPLNTFGCILFILPPCLICVLLMLFALRMTYIYFIGLVCFGAFFHLVQKAGKHHSWWSYAEAPPKRTGKKTQTTAETNGLYA